jgi:hypothetical protein
MARKLQSFCLLILLFTLAAVCQQTTSTPGDTEARVETLLKQLTLEEKIDLISGVDDFYIRGNARIGLPKLRMADGPVGVRNYGLNSFWRRGAGGRVGPGVGAANWSCHRRGCPRTRCALYAGAGRQYLSRSDVREKL